MIFTVLLHLLLLLCLHTLANIHTGIGDASAVLTHLQRADYKRKKLGEKKVVHLQLMIMITLLYFRAAERINMVTSERRAAEWTLCCQHCAGVFPASQCVSVFSIQNDVGQRHLNGSTV